MVHPAAVLGVVFVALVPGCVTQDPVGLDPEARLAIAELVPVVLGSTEIDWEIGETAASFSLVLPSASAGKTDAIPWNSLVIQWVITAVGQTETVSEGSGRTTGFWADAATIYQALVTIYDGLTSELIATKTGNASFWAHHNGSVQLTPGPAREVTFIKFAARVANQSWSGAYSNTGTFGQDQGHYELVGPDDQRWPLTDNVVVRTGEPGHYDIRWIYDEPLEGSGIVTGSGMLWRDADEGTT